MRAMALLFWAGIIVLLRVDAGRCEPRVIRDVAEATYRAGEDESPREAKQKAKDLALRRFVERVVGAHVRIEALAENTHAVYSMVDVWAVANVRIDSVVHNRYADYTADYRAYVSVARTKVDELLRAFDEITAVAVASKKKEIVERVRHQYAVIGEVEDMVLIPAEKGEPPFYIDRYPVSVLEYTRYDSDYRSDLSFGAPAPGISRKDAQEYCQKRSARFPTEIEWERANQIRNSVGLKFSQEWISMPGPRRWYQRILRTHPSKHDYDPGSVKYRRAALFRCAADGTLGF